MNMRIFSRGKCPKCPANYNRGERVEWRICYELTGKAGERNNRPATDGGDVGGWQIKSPKASVPPVDNCDGYLFGFDGENFYFEMSRAEFGEFLEVFGYVDRDSKTGEPKRRIKNDSSKMRGWLMARV